MSVEVDGRRQRTVLSHAAIIDAAERLFSEGGFHATSLRAIATAIGMSHPGVLKHFPTKSDLLVAVLQKLDSGDVAFSFAPPPDLPRDALVRLLAQHTMQQTAAINLRVLLLGEAGDPAHPAHAYVRGQLEFVEKDLEAALDCDGLALLALWNGLQLIWRYVPALDPVAVAVAHELLPAATGPREAPVVRRTPRAAAPHETREQQIVAAATDAFAQGGYHATSLRDIAATLGLSHGALLYHFPSKVALLTAVLEQRDRDEDLPWQEDADPLDYLMGMYEHALANDSTPGLARVFSMLASEAIDPGHPAHSYFAHRYERVHHELEVVLTSLVASGRARSGFDPALEAWGIIALWDGLALRAFYRDAPGDLPERLLARIDSLLIVKVNHASITSG